MFIFNCVFNFHSDESNILGKKTALYSYRATILTIKEVQETQRVTHSNQIMLKVDLVADLAINMEKKATVVVVL